MGEDVQTSAKEAIRSGGRRRGVRALVVEVELPRTTRRGQAKPPERRKDENLNRAIWIQIWMDVGSNSTRTTGEIVSAMLLLLRFRTWEAGLGLACSDRRAGHRETRTRYRPILYACICRTQ